MVQQLDIPWNNNYILCQYILCHIFLGTSPLAHQAYLRHPTLCLTKKTEIKSWSIFYLSFSASNTPSLAFFSSRNLVGTTSTLQLSLAQLPPFETIGATYFFGASDPGSNPWCIFLLVINPWRKFLLLHDSFVTQPSFPSFTICFLTISWSNLMLSCSTHCQNPLKHLLCLCTNTLVGLLFLLSSDHHKTLVHHPLNFYSSNLFGASDGSIHFLNMCCLNPTQSILFM